MELNKQKKKLVTAVKGHKLLKDKRDELMRQFLDLARENMALRLKVEEGIANANKNFVIAKAGMSEETLNTAKESPRLRKAIPFPSYFLVHAGKSFFFILVLYHSYNTKARKICVLCQNQI